MNNLYKRLNRVPETKQINKWLNCPGKPPLLIKKNTNHYFKLSFMYNNIEVFIPTYAVDFKITPSTMTAYTRCLHSGCRAWRLWPQMWYQRGSHTAAKWQSSFSKLLFWEDFHLHWHLGQNRMTFWVVTVCGTWVTHKYIKWLGWHIAGTNWYNSYAFRRSDYEKLIVAKNQLIQLW